MEDVDMSYAPKCYSKLNNNPIVKLKMVRDYHQNLFFAEQDKSNKTEIINVFLDPNNAISRVGD